MKLGLDTNALLARFEAERQVLALLDHPNVAKIFDAGSTDRGRPYFVMELVEGQRVTRYCDDRGLPLRERLAVFVTICRAVQHAHQRGIIHRDLKPSNILVAEADGKSLIKVIDFGVAKAMGHALSEHTLITHEGQLIGTPSYMSPEQADLGGMDVDVRTDVYSLGVLLYELLTGTLPFDPERLRGESLTRIIEIIRTEVPARPSAKVGSRGRDGLDAAAVRGLPSVSRLARALRSDLDWIVLRALEKDRERRYESATAFAADIERYLDDRPVDAGPPSTVYRLRKFAKRYRTPLAVSGIVLASILVALVESNRQRIAAERARDEAEAVTAFLEEMVQSVDPRGRGAETPIRELLEEGAQTIGERFSEQPLVGARLMMTIGSAYFHLGEHEAATPLLEGAVAIRERVPGSDRGDLALATNRLARAYSDAGDYDSAAELYHRALVLWTETEGPDGEDVATATNNLANNLNFRGKPDSARVLHERALAIRERTLGPSHVDVAQSLHNIAVLSAQAGALSDAADLWGRALAIREAAHGEEHPDVAQTRGNLAILSFMMGDSDKALELFGKTLAVQERTLGPNNRELASTLLNMGETLLDGGDVVGAKQHLERALAIQEANMGTAHPKMVPTYGNLGEIARLEGDLDTARRHVEKSLEILRDYGRAENVEAATGLVTLGDVELDAGNAAAAKLHFEAALHIAERGGLASRLRVPSLEGLAKALRAMGREAPADSVEARIDALSD